MIVRRKRRRVYISAALVVAVLGILLGLGIWWRDSHNTNPFPVNIRQTAGFTLYYPNDPTMKVDPQSVQLAENNTVLAYIVHYQSHQLYVTIQAKPASGLNFDTFTKRFSNPVQFLTTNGTATVGQLSGRQTGSLLTPNGWVLISSPLNTPPNLIADMLKQLVPLPN